MSKIKQGFDIAKKKLKIATNPDFCKPKSCSIVLTHNCTLRCQMCNIWRTKRKEPNTKNVTKWINDLYLFGIRDFMFTGGEPLLRNDLFELAEIVKMLECRLNIITNGTLVNKEKAALISKYFDSVGVSLDGAFSKTNDKIRGVNGAFKKAVNAIKLFNEAGVKNLRINFTIQNDNQNEVLKALSLAEELNTKIFFQFVETSGFGNFTNSNLQIVDIEKLKSQFNIVKESKYTINSKDYFKLIIDTLEGKRKNIPCFAPHVNLLIDTDGSVYPCPDLNIKMGNINKNKINDIYYSEKFTKLRKDIRRTNIGKCKVCLQACEMEGSLDFCFLHLLKEHVF